jgi:uncharacterized membrane-anchored protein YitT (DUF2179 family)
MRHSRIEDVYGLMIGCGLIVLGLVCLHRAGLVTGGIAGVALLVSYIVPWPAGLLFTLINIPFLLFAWRTMGPRFTLKTLIVSLGVTLLSVGVPRLFRLDYIDPLFAAVVGGTVIGMGVLSLARHQAGVGGTGVLTLWLQKTRGWNPGRSQLVLDAAIMLASLFVVPWSRVLLSALSAIAISSVLIAFHRPGRYTGH